MSTYFDDHAIDAGHGRRSLRAGAALFGGRGLVVVIQLATILVLARLLTPEDYGLVSMVTAITVFAPLLAGLGTPDAVVQRESIVERDISTLFWISVAIGSVVAALMAACGPLIAWFYGEPRLTWITGVSGLTFVLSALYCQHATLLRRAMKFKELAAVEVGANLLSAAAAVAMASDGFGYWALVLRPVLLAFFIACGIWLRCRWLPGRPAMSAGARDMLRLGLHSTGFQLTDYVAGSSDRVGIGHRSGATALGYYQNAMFIYENLLALLVTSAHGVVVVSLGKARTNLPELRRLWRKALLMLVFFAMPAFGVLAVTAQDLVVVLFGAKWTQAGILLSIIALRGIPHSVERTMGWLHVAAGRTDRWMRWGLVGICAQLIALFCGLPYGATGVAVAFAVCTSVLFVPAVAYSGRPFGIGGTDVLKVVWRPLTATLLAASVGFALRFTLLADASPVVRIAELGLAFVAAYAVVVAGVLGERMPLQVLRALARDAVPHRLARFTRPARVLEGCD